MFIFTMTKKKVQNFRCTRLINPKNVEIII